MSSQKLKTPPVQSDDSAELNCHIPNSAVAEACVGPRRSVYRRVTGMTRNLFEYHPVIGYRYIPGLRARVRHEGGGYLVRANADGFRSDHDFREPKPAGRYRIALFGDSYTAGEGVSNGQRFCDLLEERLPQLDRIDLYETPGCGAVLSWGEQGPALPV